MKPNHPLVERMAPLLLALVSAGTLSAQVILPGTQPEEKDIEFAKVAQCVLCHSKTENGEADPTFSWQGGVMAQAARDPLFRAALAIANQDIPGVGEFCNRCHAPRGWLEGRSTPTDASALTREDLHGVSCDVCHRQVDPLSSEAKALMERAPPGYGNAMMVVDPENVVRGPYGDGEGAMPHGVLKSDHHRSSELCATCHNVSNPTLAKDVFAQPPHTYGFVERTYSEWLLSDYAKKDTLSTCQSCHYMTVPGGGVPSRFGEKRRDHFVVHGPSGGSTWVQRATYRLWRGKDMDSKAIEAGIARTRKFLKSAALLDVSFPDPRTARVRITNLTGHKLPTGYVEGRRMWLHVKFLDAEGNVVGEVGRYGDRPDTLRGRPVTAPTILDPDATRVYECLMGMSEAQARKYGREAGKTFHFVLGDVVLKDNRIPPRGFENAAFAEHLAAPVGATYRDGQNFDEVDFPVPRGGVQVEARILFQAVSWEYLKFLVEENRTDDWGDRLYEVWSETGKCAPDEIASATANVKA